MSAKYKRGVAQGLVVGIVVLALLAGGFWWMNSNKEEPITPEENTPTNTAEEPSTNTGTESSTFDIKTLTCKDVMTATQLKLIYGRDLLRKASDGSMLDGNPYPTTGKVQENRSGQDTLSCKWSTAKDFDTLTIRVSYDRNGVTISSLMNDLKSWQKLDGFNGYLKPSARNGWLVFDAISANVTATGNGDDTDDTKIEAMLGAIDENLN